MTDEMTRIKADMPLAPKKKKKMKNWGLFLLTLVSGHGILSIKRGKVCGFPSSSNP
jgi:hypothetical protein